MFQSLRRPVIGAASICGAAVVGFLVGTDTKIAQSSWTTNHTPSTTWDWNWDKREPISLVKPDKKINSSKSSFESTINQTDEDKLDSVKSKASRYIILVRHGQYNLDGATDSDKFLSPLGEEQARLTGDRLKSLNLPITKMVFSTMTRATQTARIMMRHMQPIPSIESCDLIREGAPIPPEPPTGRWKPENHQFFIDGSRIEAGFRKHFHRAPPSQMEDSYEVVVCHANVIRYVVCRALQFPPEAWLRMSLHNGSMSMLVIRPDGRVSIRQLGECGHMPTKSLSLT